MRKKGRREREEDREKWDAFLEAPYHEILIIYLHGYQESSHCLFNLLSHPVPPRLPSVLVFHISFPVFLMSLSSLFLSFKTSIHPLVCFLLAPSHFKEGLGCS